MTGGTEAHPERREDAEAVVRLRGEGPRVVRLSRKAVGIASAAGLAVVGGALVFALRPAAPNQAEELINTKGIAVADGLAAAPRDYMQVPRLGPPLPGDLGKPILDAKERGAVAALPPIGPQAPVPPGAEPDPREAARQRMAQEREAARASQLFFGSGSAAPSPQPASGALPFAASPPAPPAREALRGEAADQRTAPLQNAAPPRAGPVLMAGSVIPAALITGIRSDQPGLVTAQVTENVFDSLGRMVVIPQGARLIGEYESDVEFGQRRVLLAWTRLVFSDGRSIMLERQPATDPAGFAGLEDGVDYHWAGVLKAALVSTLLGIGSEAGSGGDSELVRALRRGSQDSVARTGEQIVSRELGVRPTLTIRPGSPVRVLVTRDIVLEAAS